MHLTHFLHLTKSSNTFHKKNDILNLIKSFKTYLKLDKDAQKQLNDLEHEINYPYRSFIIHNKYTLGFGLTFFVIVGMLLYTYYKK
jgi:hypothetical protein